VPSKDPKALADKIIELIDNPELRTKMGERSRKIAEEKYSLDNMVNKIESLIESLIEKKIGLIWNKDIGVWETGSIL
jgi:glycosyltransferase involved in cell wall biosynthesis